MITETTLNIKDSSISSTKKKCTHKQKTYIIEKPIYIPYSEIAQNLKMYQIDN